MRFEKLGHIAFYLNLSEQVVLRLVETIETGTSSDNLPARESISELFTQGISNFVSGAKSYLM